jgi:hypothetical protein
MATKQLHFFAEIEDIKQILASVEASDNIQYCEAGIFNSFDVPLYSSYTEMPSLGYVESGDWNHNKFYAVYPKGYEIKKREVPLKKGGINYAIYQDNNPPTIILKLGGIFKDGVMIAGSIGTISDDSFSINLFNKYRNLIKKSFTKIGTFYLGSNAKKKLENGWRLVTNDRSPK